jgi:precorrin-2 dehydrogenase/sirohydrochlorin ferrochelatase
MLIDFNFEGKHVAIVGGGSESYRKTQDFLRAGAKIVVHSNTFSGGITKLSEEGKIELQQINVTDAFSFVQSLKPKPDLLVALTNDSALNVQLISAAKSAGCMVYAPDNPALSDFMLPALAQVGDVRLAISTGGKSPAMAHILRTRIEQTITPQDVLQIDLQSYLRDVLKEQISDQTTRKSILYQVLQDASIQVLLNQGEFEAAKKQAHEIIRNQKPLEGTHL